MKPKLQSATRYFLAFSLLFACYTAGAQSEARTRIALNGGWGYRIASRNQELSNSQNELLDKLRGGICYGADAVYYLGESWGLGVKYSRFASSVEYSKGILANYTKTATSTQFIGATVAGRLLNSSTGALHLAISIGYMGYTEKNTGDSTLPMLKFTGGTVGVAYDLGYDFWLSDKIAIGAQASVIGGTLNSMKFRDPSSGRDQEVKGKNNLAQLNLSAGIRFTL